MKDGQKDGSAAGPPTPLPPVSEKGGHRDKGIWGGGVAGVMMTLRGR